tara:strand:+ start:3755 stop:4627 length:873 start_codon:yes stop_codon:yes gene_type:complete
MVFACAESYAGATPWIEFSQQNGHVKVPVSVADMPGYAIFDTGSQVNAINTSFINKNGLDLNGAGRINVQGVFGTEQRTTYNGVPISLLGIETKLDSLVEVNLGFHENAILLGAGFFSLFVLQLDYPNRQMRFVTHDTIDMRKLRNVRAEQDKGSGMPIVEVEIGNGKKVWLLLDTGNTGGMVIDRLVAEGMGWLDQHQVESNITSGVNSTAVTESFRIPEFKIGPFVLEDVLVSIPAEGQSANLQSQHSALGSRIRGRKVQGLIGYDVLQHFLLTIDYKGGHVHIGLPQ